MKMKLCSSVTTDTSGEEVLFERSSSDSDYVPAESNLSFGFLSNALEETTSSNEEILEEETEVLTRRDSRKRKRSRKGQADHSQ